jgi:hypothetical protein
MKQLQTKEFCAIITIIFLLSGVLFIYPAVSSLSNNIIIKSSGQIVTPNVYAASGSPSDIQAAVDAVMAAGGGTVYLPEGDFAFDDYSQTYRNSPVGVLVNMYGFSGNIRIIGNNTILRQTQEPPSGSSMFRVEGFNGGRIRISGIKFVGNVSTGELNSMAVWMYRCKDFRIDHCDFTDFSDSTIMTSCYTGNPDTWGYNRGVIDHCTIDNPYKDVIGGSWGYGIYVSGPGREEAWIDNIDSLLGKYNELKWCVYIEDCTFSRCRHAIASIGDGYYVSRYNTFTEPRPKNYGMIDVHGCLSSEGIGGRGLEAYSNTIYAADGYDYSMAFGLRGCGGVVFDNTIVDCRYGVTLSHDVWVEKYSVKDLWIWDNTFDNVAIPVYDQYESYEENVDYFLYEKTGYTPYTYPHPLTLEN